MIYADCVEKSIAETKLKPVLIGCHGQTIYHQPVAQKKLGTLFACTWQLGEPAVLTERLHIPVVSDFRPADVAAGGQGAPLVPLLDFYFFRHKARGRVLQNIGGIANFTVIPPNANAAQVTACDTGPGNMVIDWLMNALYKMPYDRDGRTAAKGQVLQSTLDWAMAHPYFKQPPPKTAGREEFGREFAAEFLRKSKAESTKPEDAVATATALTAFTIADCYRNAFAVKMQGCRVDYILSGGGARNKTLIRMLTEQFAGLPVRICNSDEYNLAIESKEAVAFALLAWQTWHHRAGNLPASTGASHQVIMGRISHV
jgi:anhydro-N-acetylmuramic acid kinase